jgi:hypothetical protein
VAAKIYGLKIQTQEKDTLSHLRSWNLAGRGELKRLVNYLFFLAKNQSDKWLGIPVGMLG